MTQIDRDIMVSVFKEHYNGIMWYKPKNIFWAIFHPKLTIKFANAGMFCAMMLGADVFEGLEK